ncbi:MAG: glutamine--fructose-6-phosphate transaminase (isomerizing), partial [Alphaproteobacteria bacterium]|nr:glutamine--fructose-6-phosphate transaminase (isomerizing) [Alphaproteobacteria bacterium]
MCGIIGILGRGEAVPLLLEGLRRLEYRGYDSAGIATLVDGHIDRRRAEGKLANLASVLEKRPLGGTAGIGHTRWATHGVPSEANAHPHATDRVAVVHNGIIENFQELRHELEAAGHRFTSDTDTEVVAVLVTHELASGKTASDAVATSLARLRGAFALTILFAGEDDLMIGARSGSPLALGYGEGEMYLGSDALALAPLTRRLCYLEEGDWVVVRRGGAVIHDASGKVVERTVRQTELSGALIGKGNYRHFMQKEIFEQPAVLGDTLRVYINPAKLEIGLPELPVDPAKLTKLTISACGTAYYAGCVAKYWFEQLARLPVECDIASEFRYREAPLDPTGAALFVSQSGETADTLAALRYCRAGGLKALSVLNVPESTMARESDVVLPTRAGPEIGVASTKAFTTQLIVLACLAVAAARARGALDHDGAAHHVGLLAEVPSRVADALVL